MPISFAICVCVFPAAYSCITRRSRKAFVLVGDRRFCGTALGLADVVIAVGFMSCLTNGVHRSAFVNNLSESCVGSCDVDRATLVAREFLLIFTSILMD